MKNYKISTARVSMAIKLGRMVKYIEGPLTVKSFNVHYMVLQGNR